LGELAFDDDIAPPMRETIREMWVNRLAGFHHRDLTRYLRDNAASTRYVADGRGYSFKTFRRAFRVLFALQRVGALFGVTLAAEALDARVGREGECYVTRAVLVLMLAGRIVQQSRLTMSVISQSGSWVWADVIDERLDRQVWPYVRRRNAEGESEFVCIRD
jgi:hypothetical protein